MIVKSNYFRQFFKASLTPQLILLPDDPLYTIVEVNEAYLEATQNSASDLIGKPFFEAFPGNSAEPEGENGLRRVKASLSQVMQDRMSQKMEKLRYDIFIRNSLNYERRYWILHNIPILNSNDEIEFIIHSPIDATTSTLAEQKVEITRKELQWEAQLREITQNQLSKEKNFGESLIDSLPGTFYLFDEHGKFWRWNKNLEDLTGYTSGEIEQMQPLMFITKDHVDAVRKAINETFSVGKTAIEAPLLLKNRHTIPFYFSCVAIELDDKKFIIGTGIDLSEQRKERVERLRLSEILEKSWNEIYVFDEKTLRFIDVNAGARANTGYTLRELKKMTPLDIEPEYDQVHFQQLIRPLRDQIKDKIIFNTVHRRADGSFYDAEVHLQLIQQNQHKVFVAIALDKTERLKIEAQVKASLREKEVLLNEIHHRVKNNLAIVSSLLKMQASSVGDNKLERLLEESEGRIQAMAMIHELLYNHEDFSKIDFGLYIKKLLRHIASYYLDPKQIIKTNIVTDPVYLKISTAVPCALIINELITNSYKHAFTGRKNGKISIILDRSDKSITIVFNDDGVGLPKKIKSDTLGLSLVHGLTKQVGGALTIKREKGTTFTITFPSGAGSELSII